MIIVGVDPGKRGALARLDPDGSLCAIHDMPADVYGVARVLRDWAGEVIPDDFVCVVEQQWLRADQKGTSNFLIHVGEIRGAAAALGYTVRDVAPQKWKRAFDLVLTVPMKESGITARGMKTLSRAKAAELWPEQADLFKRVKDDGRAEAALIAEWYRRFGKES